MRIKVEGKNRILKTLINTKEFLSVIYRKHYIYIIENINESTWSVKIRNNNNALILSGRFSKRQTFKTRKEVLNMCVKHIQQLINEKT